MSDEENNPKSIMLPSEEERHGWKQHAGFSIFFDYKLDENGHKHWHTRIWKTTTYHEESGDVKELDGIDTRKWVNWILEKSGLDAEKISDEPEINEELEKSQLSTFSIKIQNIVVSASNTVRERVINATIHFSALPAEADITVPENSIFHLEFNAIQLETGVITSVGQAKTFVEAGKTDYVVNAKLPIPQEVGRYKLQTAIYWLSEKNALAISDNCIFKIIS